MKKKLFFVLTLLLATLLLASCGGDDTTYYTVKFDSNGSKEYQDRAIEEGELIRNAPIPTREGYEFRGWHIGDKKWDFEKDVVTAHLTLTAKWERLSFTVKFDSNGGTPVESQTVNSADRIIPPSDPTKENHIFAGWYDKDGDEWNFAFDRVTDYMTLYAKWEPCPTFTVSFDSKGGTAIDSQYIVYGNPASAPATPTKPNNAFLGWYLGDEKWDFEQNVVTENITLVAKWEVIETFTVTFDSKGGSAVAAQHIAVGGKATKPQTPEGQPLSIFIGWFYGDTEWNFDTVITSNITLTAKWIHRYTVSFDTAGAEETIPLIYVDEGGYIIKPQDPTKANSRFDGWYVGDKKWNFAEDKVTSNIILTAKWQPIPTYTVKFDSNDGTPVAEQHVLENGYVIDQGSEKEGFRLDGWYVGDKKWDFDSDTVTSSITLKAKWIETVKISYNIDGKVTTVTVDKGQAVVKPADPKKDGYVFLGWKISGKDENWEFDKIATESMTLNADFAIARTVTFDTDGGSAVAPQVVGDGQIIPKPVTSKPNHRFNGWYIAGTSIKWNFSDPVTEDIVLKAHWIPTLPVDPF